jgi:SAM-dependent methyltransferase
VAGDLQAALALPKYPRSGKYPAEQVVELSMGPSVLWLTEALTQAMDLRAGMRVLDLGCGRALSSMFLAREFGVQVWAADLWISPHENLRRVEAEGLDRHVFPLHAEAHALPFAHRFFDAAVSIDAYHYFGSADLYAAYLASFLKAGAPVGVMVPGLREEMLEVPEQLQGLWRPDFWTLHTADFWRRLWERSGVFEDVRAEFLPDSWEEWVRWNEACVSRQGADPEAQVTKMARGDLELLRADGGRYLGFVRMTARRS